MADKQETWLSLGANLRSRLPKYFTVVRENVYLHEISFNVLFSTTSTALNLRVDWMLDTNVN